MPEAQEIVDKLRDVLVAQDQSITPDMRDLAATYADLCRSANDRIRRCSQFLAQNLRTEAVHLAEANPNVLEQLTLLDFPGREDWRQLCLRYGLPEAPPLDVDSAVAINEAYAAVQPISVLLAKHRTLAMAQAPLPLRLVVMRELARLDSTATFWADDIQIFENARVGEIRRLVAERPDDYGMLEHLESELNSGQWSHPVPGDLLQDVHARVEKFRDQHARRDVRQLMPELDAQYSAMNEGRCRVLLERCAAALRGRSPEADIGERMGAVQGWLSGLEQARKQQRDFEAACTALEQAIDTGRAAAAIEQAYKATTRYSLPLPIVLEHRFKQTMSRRKREAVRRQRMIYFTVAAATLVLLTAIGLYAFFTMRAHEAQAWDQVLRAATADVIGKGDLAYGEKIVALLARQPTGLRAAPAIAADAAELQSAVAAEKHRVRRFVALYSKARTMAIGSARSLQLMATAREIARRPAEIAEVKKWFRRRNAYDQQQQAARDSAFNRAARKLLGSIDLRLARSIIKAHANSAASSLQRCNRQLRLLEATKGVTPAVYNAEIASLQAVLSRRGAMLADVISDNQDYAQLLVPPLNVNDYAAALKKYLRLHPDGQYASRVKMLTGLEPTIRAVNSWADLRENFVGSLLNPIREDAKARVAGIEKYVKAFPISPFVPAAVAYERYLKGGLAATAADGPWLGRFSTVLHNRLLRALDTFSTSDGRTYFVKPGTQVNKNTVGSLQELSFRAITSAAGGQTTIALPVGVTVTSKRPQPSLQAVLSRRLSGTIAVMRFDQWNTVGFQEMRQLENSGASPVVKGLLLADIIVLEKPSLLVRYQGAFSPASHILKSLNLENINWLNPSKPVHRAVAHGVQKAFEKLPDLKTVIAITHRANKALARAVDFNIDSFGICYSAAHMATIRCSLPPKNGDAAWIIVPKGTDRALKQLGVMRGGKWEFVPAVAADLTNGDLVFILTSKR